jgi:hypothetical protein
MPDSGVLGVAYAVFDASVDPMPGLAGTRVVPAGLGRAPGFRAGGVGREHLVTPSAYFVCKQLGTGMGCSRRTMTHISTGQVSVDPAGTLPGSTGSRR